MAGVENKELLISKMIEQGGDIGYDFKTGELKDMMECGVIEPTKVIRCVIENSVSIAMNFLSMSATVTYPKADPLKIFSEALKNA